MNEREHWPSWMGEHPREGVRWCHGESIVMAAAYRKGDSLQTLAQRHGRSPGGINSRLLKLLDENFYTRSEAFKLEALATELRTLLGRIEQLIRLNGQPDDGHECGHQTLPRPG